MDALLMNVKFNVRKPVLTFWRRAVRSITMQYSQFEKILADTFAIKAKNLGAFRARLRHLRNLGVPDVPKRGSGNTVIYKTDDLLTAIVALQLQTLGCAPAVSAELATFARGHFGRLEWSDADVFLWVRNIAAEIPELEARSISGGPPKFEKPPAGSAKVPVPPGGIVDFLMMKNPLGGITQARVVIGADEAGLFVTNAQALASSLINISAHLRALPKER
jgi:hypothetical protein